MNTHSRGRRPHPAVAVASLVNPLFLVLGSALSWTSSGAAAGEASDSQSRVLEEVVVTGQRREENLLEVPLAVTAISGERLESLGALDIGYLGQVSPNTTIEVAAGTNNSIAATIRGIGHQQHIAGFESGVGLYVDDVYYNRPQLSLLDLYDVERIEVLRGPQGTLYGRNTIGGAVKYVTRRLGDQAQVRLHGRIGSHGMRDAIVAGAVPLGDSLRVGGSFASLDLDGFGVNRYQQGEENYNKKLRAARVSAEWQPSVDWFVRLAGDWIQDDSDLRRGHRIFVGTFSGAPILDNVFDTRAGNAFPVADARATGVSLTAEWQATDKLQLRGILASRHDDTWKPVDLDGLPAVDVDVATWDGNRQKTAELQAIFDGDRIDAVAGAFTIDARAGTVLGVVLGNTGELIGRPGLGNELRGDVGTDSWALFADFSIKFHDLWSGSLGGRYTRDRRSAFVGRQVTVGGISSFFGGPAIPVATTSDFFGSEVFTRFTPRAALQWQPDDDQYLYVNYSEGFKGGGFDPRGLSSEAPDSNGDGVVSATEVHQFMKFLPEEVVSRELGWKSVFFGGRMNSRLALFTVNYKNVQIPGAVSVDENGDGVAETWIGITTNAASADIDGLEWEGQAVLADDLWRPDGVFDLSWALAWIDARYGEFIDAIGEDVALERAFGATPEWMLSATAHYGVPVGWFGRDGHLTVTTTLSRRGDENQTEVPDPLADQPAFTLWDLSMIYAPRGSRWKIGLHGRNLTDARYKVSKLDITIGLENNYTVYFGNPRQFWLDLQYSFDQGPR